MVRVLLASMPQPLARLFAEEAGFSARVGLAAAPVMYLGDHVVDVERVWQAAAQAYDTDRDVPFLSNGGHQLIASIEGANGSRAFGVRDKANRHRYLLLVEGVDVLSPSAAVREAALREVPHWFDRLASERDDAIATIAALDDPVERWREIVQHRMESAEAHYRGLATQLRDEARIDVVSDLRPGDPRSLLRHLRLKGYADKSTKSVQSDVSDAAVELIQDIGLEESIDRLASLPIPLPSPVVQAYRDLTEAKQRSLTKRLVRRLGISPIGSLHLAKLLLAGSSGPAPYSRLSRRIVSRTVDQKHEDFVAWLAVLRASVEDWSYVDSFRTMSVVQRLIVVWMHGDRLYRTMRESGVPTSWMA